MVRIIEHTTKMSPIIPEKFWICEICGEEFISWLDGYSECRKHETKCIKTIIDIKPWWKFW